MNYMTELTKLLSEYEEARKTKDPAKIYDVNSRLHIMMTFMEGDVMLTPQERKKCLDKYDRVMGEG